MKTVYSLTASDEPLQVRYVGCTKRPLARRLTQHWGQFANPNKRAWMDAVVARGAKVEIRALSEHHTFEDMKQAECRWWYFWRDYCDLLNGNTPYCRTQGVIHQSTAAPQLNGSALTQAQVNRLILLHIGRAKILKVENPKAILNCEN